MSICYFNQITLNNINTLRDNFAPHIISNRVWLIIHINTLRCSRHLFVRTISTNPYAKIITQISVTSIKSQRLKQYLHSEILWTHQKNFRLVFHLVNTHIYSNPQWRIQNNDFHYLLKYYTSLCKIFNILLYTLFTMLKNYTSLCIMFNNTMCTLRFPRTRSLSHFVQRIWFTCVKRSSI